MARLAEQVLRVHQNAHEARAEILDIGEVEDEPPGVASRRQVHQQPPQPRELRGIQRAVLGMRQAHQARP